MLVVTVIAAQRQKGYKVVTAGQCQLLRVAISALIQRQQLEKRANVLKTLITELYQKENGRRSSSQQMLTLEGKMVLHALDIQSRHNHRHACARTHTRTRTRTHACTHTELNATYHLCLFDLLIAFGN